MRQSSGRFLTTRSRARVCSMSGSSSPSPLPSPGGRGRSSGVTWPGFFFGESLTANELCPSDLSSHSEPFETLSPGKGSDGSVQKVPWRIHGGEGDATFPTTHRPRSSSGARACGGGSRGATVPARADKDFRTRTAGWGDAAPTPGWRPRADCHVSAAAAAGSLLARDLRAVAASVGPLAGRAPVRHPRTRLRQGRAGTADRHVEEGRGKEGGSAKGEQRNCEQPAK